MEASMENTCNYMEANLLPWKYIGGWKLPMLVEVETSSNTGASTTTRSVEAAKSLHITSTYCHEFSELPYYVHRLPLLPPASIDFIISMEVNVELGFYFHFSLPRTLFFTSMKGS